MALRRLTPVLLLALLLGAMPLLTKDLAQVQELAEPVPRMEVEPATPRRVVAPSLERETFGRVGRAAGPLTLTADAASLLVDQLALRQLAADSGLELSDEQWTVFARITTHHQAIRHSYEATIAVRPAAADAKMRLEVPAYGEAGEALREEFYLSLEVELGAAAEQIAAAMGRALDGYFGGFGASVQTLEFDAAPGSRPDDYIVTRTITYWNETADQERLTTRRESHWPSIEDPTGQQWGPFLALLAERLRSRS